MIIRTAKKSDIEKIYSLSLELCDYEDNFAMKIIKAFKHLRSRRDDCEKRVKKQILKEMKQNDSKYLVAEINGKVVGYCYGSIEKSKYPIFIPATVGHLNFIVVNKKSRGKGISTKLHNEILKWFKEKKCSAICLQVFVNIPAVEIYKKWDYKVATCKMWKEI